MPESTKWNFPILAKFRFLRMMFSMHVRLEGWTMAIESRYKKKKCEDFLFEGPLILKLANIKKYSPL